MNDSPIFDCSSAIDLSHRDENQEHQTLLLDKKCRQEYELVQKYTKYNNLYRHNIGVRHYKTGSIINVHNRSIQYVKSIY